MPLLFIAKNFVVIDFFAVDERGAKSFNKE